MSDQQQAAGLHQNIDRARASIAAACQRGGRRPDEVALMAVTKTHPAAAISAAAALGVTLFGENKVQEFESKRTAISASSDFEIHLIGHLQSNKSARAAGLFSSIDTLDSLRLALRLSDAAQKAGKRLPILIEIKLGAEAAKTGLAPDSRELDELLERLPDLPALELRGLMTVPPYEQDPEATRPYFQRLRQLREQLARDYPRLSFHELSMGMSHDFQIAIEEGSTTVRLGTALFGPRPIPAS